MSCYTGAGYLIERDGSTSKQKRYFPKNSVGLTKSISAETAVIWLIGLDELWQVALDDTKPVDVFSTGDQRPQKICNICHRILSVDEFAINQNNKKGPVRRPSCKQCRTDIDKRAPKTRQAKQAEQNKPKKGEAFRCPICRKRSIVGITAKIVADHNHHTGNIRDFICDSCNTGLGRFKNGENYLYNAIEYLKERDGEL